MNHATRLVRVALILTLALSPLTLSGCGEKKSTQHRLAIYTAQSYAALVALTDATARLADARRVSPEAAKKIYQINLRAAGAVDILRDRAKVGFDKRDALALVDSILEDVRRAETEGVISLSGETKARFLQITFFAQFTLRSVKAIIEAAQPPVVAKSDVVAVLGKQRSDETVWTDLVLILQNAVLRGISQSRMTVDAAFADGAQLSAELKANLGARLAG